MLGERTRWTLEGSCNSAGRRAPHGTPPTARGSHRAADYAANFERMPAGAGILRESDADTFGGLYPLPPALRGRSRVGVLRDRVGATSPMQRESAADHSIRASAR